MDRSGEISELVVSQPAAAISTLVVTEAQWLQLNEAVVTESASFGDVWLGIGGAWQQMQLPG